MVNKFVVVLVFLITQIHCRNHHVIDFRWTDLSPGHFTWDPKSEHFIVASIRLPQLISVSDAGVVSSLLLPSDSGSLPSDSSFRSVSLDPRHHRILAVIRRDSPPYSAIAAYDLPSFTLRFIAPLDDLLPSTVAANDVTVDYSGNAYVTDSANDVIYKVTEQGEATILSRSVAFKSLKSGLNGVVYNPKGYLLVAKSDSGRLFKVNTDDGSAKAVTLNKELPIVENGGISLRKNGIVSVLSPENKVYFIKSDDSWSAAAVIDETKLDGERQGTAVAAGAENRVYVLYGHVGDGVSERDEFSIAEAVAESERKEENVWIYVAIGLGLAYFTFWRFQMKQLAQNMNKKTS